MSLNRVVNNISKKYKNVIYILGIYIGRKKVPN